LAEEGIPLWDGDFVECHWWKGPKASFDERGSQEQKKFKKG